ncbi:MAG TPA: ATP-binding protein, partial [Desulfobacterales bacterium]|nr:ATP-binding protein [Desulfobacterales bacterium]
MFDNIEELIKKIQLGEDSILELKSISMRGNKVTAPDRKDLADEFAAFGNSYNGVLVLGVDDKTKEIEGIPQESLDIVETYVRDICNDSIDPPLNVRIIKMTLPDLQGIDRPIIKIDIPRSLFVHKSPHGYFYRQGSSKREMKPEYLARLFQQRSQARLIRFEEQ